MVKRYDDPVDVRPVDTGSSEGSEPATFLWRGRLYVVREVLGHWRERRAWWTAPAARVLHGEDDPVPEGPAEAVARGGGLRGAPGALVRSALGEEREVWRVEASRGRAFGTGVYDLCRDLPVHVPAVHVPAVQVAAVHAPAVHAPAVPGQWRLLRVAD